MKKYFNFSLCRFAVFSFIFIVFSCSGGTTPSSDAVILENVPYIYQEIFDFEAMKIPMQVKTMAINQYTTDIDLSNIDMPRNKPAFGPLIDVPIFPKPTPTPPVPTPEPPIYVPPSVIIDDPFYMSVPFDRSREFCGIASALMVRAKNKIGEGEPDLDRKKVDADILTMDSNLRYGVYGSTSIDVMQDERGLVYIDDEGNQTNWAQFERTKRVLSNIYTAKKTDNVYYDNGLVSGIEMKPIWSTDVAYIIWEHIFYKKQPVVVLIDSNKLTNATDKDDPEAVFTSFDVPTLHYNVIYGVKLKNGGRIFNVHDPLSAVGKAEYNEKQLIYLMKMPSNAPAWIYDYPYQDIGISSPCYIGLVEGD